MQNDDKADAATPRDDDKPADGAVQGHASESKATKATKASDKPAPTDEDYPDPTIESGGPKGLEPTRYGDWERKGILSDF